MKRLISIVFLSLTLFLSSCSSGIRVVRDYDKEIDFTSYNTYAFHKPSVDAAKISDLDKRRILRAIDRELAAKGMVKSESPQLIIGIYTKEQERVDIYQNYYGWGWHPYYHPFGPSSQVSRSTEGTLFIDFLDAKKKCLIWQGIGYADLIVTDMEKKEKRINEIVAKILEAYPPQRD
mgnify:CR=1 FL=1